MPQNFIGGGDRGQGYLLPPDAREWLPPGHLAWALLEQAARLDMAPFAGWYRAGGQGRPAYHPRLMVALVMSCYCKGVRSSRAVEMATWDDVGARVICAGLHPDHSTVHRFVSRHEAAVKGLLVASLVACARQGLVSVDVVAGDGTKVKASASMAANATAEQLEVEIAELEALLAAEVEAWFTQAEAADQAEEALFGGDDDDGGGPGPLARLADKIVRLRKAGARLEKQEQARQEQAAAGQQERLARARQRMARAEERAAREEAAAAARVRDYQRRAAAKAAAGGRGRPDGRVPVAAGGSAHVRRARQAADRARRVMPAKHGGFPQGYNVQVLGGRHQVIYAIATHDNPADTAALHPLLAQARGNLDAAGIRDPIGTALFDAGYASDANFTAACQAELYVAVTKEARQTGRLRDGKTPASALPSWQAMAARLDTPDGKALYRRRPAIIEPVFAQLFNRLGRDLHYRDTKTDLELHLRAASHNFLKAIRRNQRRTPPAPGLAPAS